MNRRRVGGTVLVTVATGAIALAAVKVIQRQLQGIVPSLDDLKWLRELVDRLRRAEAGDESTRAMILAAAYRDLRIHSNIIASKQLRRRLNRVIRQDLSLADEVLVDLERLLGELEEAVARRSIGKDDE